MNDAAGQALHQPAGEAAVRQHTGAVGHAQAVFRQPFKQRLALHLALMHRFHVFEVETIANHGAPVGGHCLRPGRQPVVAAIATRKRQRRYAIGRRVQPNQAKMLGAWPSAYGQTAAGLDVFRQRGGGGLRQ